MKTIKRRKKERKTDYLKRLKLLKSEAPRVVFRKTNKYIIAQYITSNGTEDNVEIGINSKKLVKYGWPEKQKNSLKSLPASYLTGFLLGNKIIKNKKETPIVDFGMIRSIHKTKVFSFVKGLVDSGVKIKYKENTFPGEERIKGKHLKNDFTKIFSEIKEKIKSD